MQNHSYNIDLYSSALKSEVIKLYIVATVLSILFIFVIVCSIIQIKKEKTKKIPYVQLLVAIIVFIFLLIPLSSQISSFTKDIVEQKYVQYEGPANVRAERKIILGGIPTGYTEYIISFEYNGEQIELSMRKDPGIEGNVEKIYIAYSQYSEFILEITE